jgi:hypothetical protein
LANLQIFIRYEAAALGEEWIIELLVEYGAGSSVRHKTNGWSTPLYIAVQNSHLGVAQKLLAHGGASRDPGSSSSNVGGKQPDYNASHVDSDALWLECAGRTRELSGLLGGSLRVRASFVATVLFGVCCGSSGSVSEHAKGVCTGEHQLDSWTPVNSTKRLQDGTVCHLAALRGHESTIVRLVADYAGVFYGRPLRHLREAQSHLHAQSHMQP